MSNQVGPKYLAIFVLAQTYSLVINDIFNIQTWESMIKFGSEKLGSENVIQVVKTNLLLDIVSAVIAFILALVLLHPVAIIFGWDVSFLHAISLYTISIIFNITTLTIGIPRLFDKFLFIAKLQVSVALLKLVFVISALFFANSFIVYLYIYIFADIIMNISIIIYSMRLMKVNYGSRWWKRQFLFDKQQIIFIWWTNLRTVARIPVRHFDMIAISSVLSIQMVGIYKVYKELSGLINRVGDPINQAIFPIFTRLLGENKISKTVDVTKRIIIMLCALGGTITLVMLILSKFLVSTFFDEVYLSHIYVFQIMIILYGINFILLPINSLFIAAGFAKYSFNIVLFSNIIYLISVYNFGRLFGIVGIILAFVIQMCLNQGLKIILLKKYKSDWGKVVR